MNQRVHISVILVLVVILTTTGGPNALPGKAASLDQRQAMTEHPGNIPLVEPASNVKGAGPNSLFPPYTITEISTPDLTGYTAWGINDAGDVVGCGFPASGGDHAFLWKKGVMTDLGTLGGKNSYAYGINNKGQIVGEAWTVLHQGFYYRHGFIWENGEMKDLTPDSSDSMANEINEAGQAVGAVYSIAYGQWRGIIAQAGGMTDLGSLFGFETDGVSINNLGQVVGFSEDDSGREHAFLWQQGGGIINLLADLLPDSTYNWANDINDEGQVVGSAWMPLVDQFHAYLYQIKNKALIDLGVLGGYDFSDAKAINKAGQVVGHSRFLNGPQGQTPFLWQDENRNGKSDPYEMVDLNLLLPAGSGWSLTYVSDINNKGQIVGWGLHNGVQRAYLLTPVPTWTLMFYLDGDNGLGSSYETIFNQLEKARFNPHVNTVVLWDNVLNNDSAYYEIQYDVNDDLYPKMFWPYVEGVNKWSLGEVKMSDPGTLSNFIKWAEQNYPTENYALILDDHGTGLGGGLCDFSGTYACMSLTGIQQALATASAATGKKINVLSMSMCLMGMLEDAYQFRNLTDYYVSSEYLAWNPPEAYFGYVAGVRATSTPAQVATLFATSYHLTLKKDGHKPYTIAAADMTGLNDVVVYTNILGKVLDSRMSTIAPTLTSIAAQVQRFDNKDPRGIDAEDTYVDLYDFARLAASDLSTYEDILSASEQLMLAIDRYLLFEGHGSTPGVNLDHSHGVSVFFPAKASSFYKASNYDFAVGGWGSSTPLNLPAQADTWAGMLVDYFQITQPGGIDDPTPPEPMPLLMPEANIYLPIISRSAP